MSNALRAAQRRDGSGDWEGINTDRFHCISNMADFPTYFTLKVSAGNGHGLTISMADLAIPTVAALSPSGMGIGLYDENAAWGSFDDPADFIAITAGKVTQFGRMVAIARGSAPRERRSDQGPSQSLPERVRPHCDIITGAWRAGRN